MRHASKLAGVLIGILLAAVVFAPVPGETLWLSRLHDFAHAPVFGCVAVLLLVALRRRRPFAALGRAGQYALAFAGAAALGLLTELAQIPAGGDASWSDAAHDLIGAVAFLTAFSVFDARAGLRKQSTWVRVSTLLVALPLFAYLVTPIARSVVKYHERRNTFPVIADFSHGFDSYFVWPNRVLVEFAPLPDELSASPGESAARVRFLPEQYAGVNFHEPWPDWRGYSTLAIELANPTGGELELVVRVHDASHNNELDDRYNHAIKLPARTRQAFRFPLEDIRRAPRGRAMDMQRIRGVVVFRIDDSSSDEMYLRRIWLE